MDAASRPAAWRFDRFTLDLARSALLGPDGNELPLRPKSMALLRLLVENAGRVVDRDTIMGAVWADVIVTDESITQCVRDIRKALGDEAQRMLRTVPKRGYLLAVEVMPAGTFWPTPGGKRRPLVQVAALFAVLLLGGVWHFRPGAPLPREKPAIAVLPFNNLGGDEATGRLADGVAEDIITDLARFREINVIARNSTFVYKSKATDVRQVGKELNVDYVLEGSIQRQADRVRVTAQLVEADTGAHVWSERWDRPVADVFAVQSEVADAVAGRLGGHGVIAGAARDLARRKPPTDLTAYDLYLLGIEQKHRLTKESQAEAIRLLKQAVERDPQLSRAWTGLAWAYTISAGFAASPEEEALFNRQLLEAATRAVQTDPADAEAHAALGEAVGMAGDLARAQAEIEKALALNPSGSMPLFEYASWASAFGEPEKGAEAADRLIRIDPNLRAVAPGGVSYAYFMVGRYEDALRELTAKPEESLLRMFAVIKAGALAMLDRGEEAKAVVARALGRFPDLTIESFVGRPEWADHERRRYVETMRKAGFPACASAAEIARLAKPIRLPDCEAERTGVAAVKAG